jgi:hypothetical protein
MNTHTLLALALASFSLLALPLRAQTLPLTSP